MELQVAGSPAEPIDARLAALAERRRAAIRSAFARLHPLALGCALGVVLGGVLLAATLVLRLRGGSRVGATLQTVASYFPGYSVDGAGAFVGGLYGFAAGFLAGYLVAAFRNLALGLVLAHARRSAERWRRRHLLDEV